MTNKQELREAAEKAGAEVWCAFIDTKSKTYAVHTPDDDRCGDVVKWPGLDGQQRAAAKARFIAAANPATVLALLDELEAAEKRGDKVSLDYDTLVDAANVIAEQRDELILRNREMAELLISLKKSRPGGVYFNKWDAQIDSVLGAAGRINGEG